VLHELQLGLQCLQVLFGGDVVVDRVEDLGGDAFGLLAVDIGVRQGIGQGKPVFETGLNIVDVDDVAAGHLAAAELGRVGERYILGGENSLPDAARPGKKGSPSAFPSIRSYAPVWTRRARAFFCPASLTPVERGIVTVNVLQPDDSVRRWHSRAFIYVVARIVLAQQH